MNVHSDVLDGLSHALKNQIAKTANYICDDPECNRIKLIGQLTGLIIESNDADGPLGCLE
jgi:hypothetical protein